MVEDIKTDREGGTPCTTHMAGIENLSLLKTRYCLQDIWRKKHPNDRKYTYHNTGYKVKSRLDRVYSSPSINITKAEITNFNVSDHDEVTVTIQENNNTRGPGYWKMNTSILKH